MTLENLGDLEKGKFFSRDGKSYVRYITAEHDYIHDGKLFFSKSFIEFNGGDEETQYFMFVTPDSDIDIHARLNIAGGVEFEVYLLEGATTSANGTEVTTYNANRKSSTAPTVKAYAGPTVTGEGTNIWTVKLGSGKTSSGVGPSTNYEFIAKNNVKYVFKMIKKVANVSYLDFDFHWYEASDD